MQTMYHIKGKLSSVFVKYFAPDVGGLLKEPGTCITVLAKTKWKQ